MNNHFESSLGIPWENSLRMLWCNCLRNPWGYFPEQIPLVICVEISWVISANISWVISKRILRRLSKKESHEGTLGGFSEEISWRFYSLANVFSNLWGKFLECSLSKFLEENNYFVGILEGIPWEINRDFFCEIAWVVLEEFFWGLCDGRLAICWGSLLSNAWINFLRIFSGLLR